MSDDKKPHIPALRLATFAGTLSLLVLLSVLLFSNVNAGHQASEPNAARFTHFSSGTVGGVLERFTGMVTNGTDVYTSCSGTDHKIYKINLTTGVNSVVHFEAQCGFGAPIGMNDTGTIWVVSMGCDVGNVIRVNTTTGIVSTFQYNETTSFSNPFNIADAAVTWDGAALHYFGSTGNNHGGLSCQNWAQYQGVFGEFAANRYPADDVGGCVATEDCVRNVTAGVLGAPACIDMGAVYVPTDNSSYIFGGQCGVPQTALQEFRSKNVTKHWSTNNTVGRVLVSHPDWTARSKFGVAHDTKRNLTYIFGGQEENGVTRSDALVFCPGNNTFYNSSNTLPQGYGYAAVYNPTKDRVYVVGGGFAEFMEFDPTGFESCNVSTLGGPGGPPPPAGSSLPVEAGKIEGSRYGADYVSYNMARSCFIWDLFLGASSRLGSAGKIEKTNCVSDVLGYGANFEIAAKMLHIADGLENTSINFSIGSVFNSTMDCEIIGGTESQGSTPAPEGCDPARPDRTVAEWDILEPDFLIKRVNVFAANYTLQTLTAETCPQESRRINVTLTVTRTDFTTTEYLIAQHNTGTFACSNGTTTTAGTNFDILIDPSESGYGCFLPWTDGVVGDSRTATADICDDLNDVIRVNVTFKSQSFQRVNVTLGELHLYEKGANAFYPAHLSYAEYLVTNQPTTHRIKLDPPTLDSNNTFPISPGTKNRFYTAVGTITMESGGDVCSRSRVIGKDLFDADGLGPGICYDIPWFQVVRVGNRTTFTVSEVQASTKVVFDGFTVLRGMDRMVAAWSIENIGSVGISVRLRYEALANPINGMKYLVWSDASKLLCGSATNPRFLGPLGVNFPLDAAGSSGFAVFGQTCIDYNRPFETNGLMFNANPEISANLLTTFSTLGFDAKAAQYTSQGVGIAGQTKTKTINLTTDRNRFFGRTLYLIGGQPGLDDPFQLLVRVNGEKPKPIAKFEISPDTTYGAWEILSRTTPDSGAGFYDSGWGDVGNLTINVTLAKNGTLVFATSSVAGRVLLCSPQIVLCFGNTVPGGTEPIVSDVRFDIHAQNGTGIALPNARAFVTATCGPTKDYRAVAFADQFGDMVVDPFPRGTGNLCIKIEVQNLEIFPALAKFVVNFNVPPDINLIRVTAILAAESKYEYDVETATLPSGQKVLLVTNIARNATLGTIDNPLQPIDTTLKNFAIGLGFAGESGLAFFAILSAVVFMLILYAIFAQGRGDDVPMWAMLGGFVIITFVVNRMVEGPVILDIMLFFLTASLTMLAYHFKSGSD